MANRGTARDEDTVERVTFWWNDFEMPVGQRVLESEPLQDDGLELASVHVLRLIEQYKVHINCPWEYSPVGKVVVLILP